MSLFLAFVVQTFSPPALVCADLLSFQHKTPRLHNVEKQFSDEIRCARVGRLQTGTKSVKQSKEHDYRSKDKGSRCSRHWFVG